jgi:hypothetical protein
MLASWGRSVRIVTRFRARQRRIRSSFSSWDRPDQRPILFSIQWVPGVLSTEVRCLGRNANHRSPSSAEVKDMWSYTSTPPYVFMAWFLVKRRKSFARKVSVFQTSLVLRRLQDQLWSGLLKEVCTVENIQ